MLKKWIIWLKRRGCFAFLPDKLFYDIIYRIHFRVGINWKEPKTFSEKLNWLKLYDRKPVYKYWVDKYEVRNYIEKTIGSKYLIPIYGVWDKYEDINFDELPPSFVLKCTHDSGSVMFIKDKNIMNHEKTRKFFYKRLKVDFFHYSGREWVYKGLKPRIIAEKYMNMSNNNGIQNYKIYCFNGEPRFLQIECGLTRNNSTKLDFYDFDLNVMPFFRKDHPRLDSDVIKPRHMDEMIAIAQKLSKDVPFLRVDLYEIEDTIYFSELTFYPGSGYVNFYPQEWNNSIGDYLKLPLI